MTYSGYLLDTNVVSELRRKNPAPQVLDWFSRTEDERLYFSVLSVGEIRRGIEKVSSVERRGDFTAWLEQELIPWFGAHLLPVDLAIAECWGQAGRCGRALLANHRQPAGGYGNYPQPDIGHAQCQ